MSFWQTTSTYWLTRFVILRLLGFVFAIAFFTAAVQLVPLIGANGLIPAQGYLDRINIQLGSPLYGFFALPSIFWIDCSDLFLQIVPWFGFILSLFVLAGYANSIMIFILWFFYMSIIHVGQDWYGYGWEIQMLETAFLAAFLCPLWDARPFPKRPPPIAIIYLFRWLIFRIMIGAGLIKMNGDSCWRDLTALYYHFETQPIPNPLSRYFHFLPHLLLKIGTFLNHVIELVVPWFCFGPRLARTIAGILFLGFQITLILSGNLSFLNWLTIIPGLACFDDTFWKKVLPQKIVSLSEKAQSEAVESKPMLNASWAVLVIVALLSVQPTLNLISPHQIMNTSFDRLHLVNTYGAFGSVGRERLAIIFQGTSDEKIDDQTEWKEYSFVGLPSDLKESPRQIAPYQPRLDWQLWFAAMSDANHYPWTLNLTWKLLNNDPEVLGLFSKNPFPDQPPRYIRAILYKYQFAPLGNPEGHYWNRTPLGVWLPVLSKDNPEFVNILRRVGWLKQDQPY